MGGHMTDKKSKPLCIYFLIVLMIFQGLSGLGGGIGLIIDPSGETLHIPLNWLQGSPFSDFLIPGIILLLVLGLFPLAVSYALIRKLSWSWMASLVVGIALIIWIVVEILIIGYQPKPPLQLIYGLAGIFMVILVLLPGVRRYYTS
ncbi:MAG: hypothetical protein KKA81_07755 [Bacteroidetes bacterium]|nr:hypothetical protein [Bacteroidota bacterium]